MKILTTISVLVFLALLFTIYENLLAYKGGITGFTKKNGNELGCYCHGFIPNDSISIKISGPTHVEANDTAIYVLSIANGPAIAGGCDIAVDLGKLYTSPLDTSLQRAEAYRGSAFELTHKYPKLFSGDTLKFIFKYVAPVTPNVTDTIYANGNSVNRDTTPQNDKWNYASNFGIAVIPTFITLNLKIKLEASSPKRDTITVLLRDTVSPYPVVDSVGGVIDSTGSVTLNFSNAVYGGRYYLIVKHRNSIETWSKAGGEVFTGGVLTYDFTISASQAYGNNQVLVGNEHSLYTGDVDQNSVVNLLDILNISNDGSIFTTGYVVTDLNYDNVVNLADLLYAYNNFTLFVSLKRP